MPSSVQTFGVGKGYLLASFRCDIPLYAHRYKTPNLQMKK